MPERWDRAREPVVGMIGQKLDGARLDPVALLDETAPFRQHQAEHADRVRVRRHGQAHGSL